MRFKENDSSLLKIKMIQNKKDNQIKNNGKESDTENIDKNLNINHKCHSTPSST